MEKPDYKLLIRYLRENEKVDNKQTDNNIRENKDCQSVRVQPEEKPDNI